MRVLVSYGSKMGGTAGIAELVGQALTDAGFQADVRPVSEVDRIEAYDAVPSAGRCTQVAGTGRHAGSSSATPARCARGRCGCFAAGH